MMNGTQHRAATWNCPPGLHAASWWTPLHIAGTALTALYVVALLCAVVAFRRRLGGAA